MKHKTVFKSRLFQKIGKVCQIMLSVLVSICIWLLALYSLNFM